MKSKTGFLTRLSHIIVIQVLFVFAALALIIFYPNEGTVFDSGYSAPESRIEQLLAQVKVMLSLPSEVEEPATVDPDVQALLTSLFSGFNEMLHTGIYLPDSADQLRSCYVYRHPDKLNQSDGSHAQLLPFINATVPPFDAGMAQERLIPILYTADAAVYCYTFRLDTGRRVVLVSAVEHDLVISSGPTLRYALLLLFLGSILISLLTVHLISNRFRGPLRRLISGMEKTARGELDQMVAEEKDVELEKLNLVFNNMSTTLYNNRRQLVDSNARLQMLNEQLYESTSFLATLIDSTPNSIFTTSSDGKIMLFNARAAHDFGFSPDEAIGMEVNDLLANQRAVGGDDGFEVVCRRKDGSVFPAYMLSVPIRCANNPISAYLFIVRDISESKNFQEMMIRLDRYYTRGEMAGDIAHEINNFLAILSGNVELMPLMMKKGDTEKIEKKLELMKTAIDKIVRFTDGLMDCNMGEVHFDTADINQLVQNVVAFLKPQNRYDDVEVIVKPSDDLPLGEIDIEQLQQLLVNLINNAAEALEDGPDEPRIEICTSLVESADDPRKFRIEVRDNGKGIDPENTAIVFKKRFTTKRKGHGIGLITCRRIVDAHYGTIDYRFDKGAVFTVELPVSRQQTASAEPTNESSLTGK